MDEYYNIGDTFCGKEFGVSLILIYYFEKKDESNLDSGYVYSMKRNVRYLTFFNINNKYYRCRYLLTEKKLKRHNKIL